MTLLQRPKMFLQLSGPEAVALFDVLLMARPAFSKAIQNGENCVGPYSPSTGLDIANSLIYRVLEYISQLPENENEGAL